MEKFKNAFLSIFFFKATRFHYKPLLLTLIFLMMLLLILSIYIQKQISIISRNIMFKGTSSGYYISINISSDDLVKIPSLNELKVQWVKKKIERMSKKMKKFLINKVADVKELPRANYNVHVFYYAWYKTLDEDGIWQHWNKEQNSEGDNNSYPPEDISSSFYPYLGCYSSKNSSVINYHMEMIRKAGIGVVVVTWLPPSNPNSPGSILQILMDTALRYEIKVAFQIYSYENRTLSSIFNQIKYLMLNVGEHPALYLLKRNNKFVPVYYIHESFKISDLMWEEILSKNGNLSIRKTKYDGIFIGHLEEQRQRIDLKHGYFDGLYTYSSGNGLTYGSSWKNWNSIAKFCKENELLFVPSIGPGFSNIIFPKNTRHRLRGNYYEVAWRSALSVKPKFIGITSYNNWLDGSQLEPARPKKTFTRTYFDYEPEGPFFYLNLTRWWIKKFLSVENSSVIK